MFGRQWPVWNVVTSCVYKSGKSYGVRDTGEVEVRVGTGSKCSEVLVRHFTTRRVIRDVTVFKFGYQLPGQDAVVVAEKKMHTTTRQWIE